MLPAVGAAGWSDCSLPRRSSRGAPAIRSRSGVFSNGSVPAGCVKPRASAPEQPPGRESWKKPQFARVQRRTGWRRAAPEASPTPRTTPRGSPEPPQHLGSSPDAVPSQEISGSARAPGTLAPLEGEPNGRPFDRTSLATARLPGGRHDRSPASLLALGPRDPAPRLTRGFFPTNAVAASRLGVPSTGAAGGGSLPRNTRRTPTHNPAGKDLLPTRTSVRPLPSPSGAPRTLGDRRPPLDGRVASATSGRRGSSRALAPRGRSNAGGNRTDRRRESPHRSRSERGLFTGPARGGGFRKQRSARRGLPRRALPFFGDVPTTPGRTIVL